MDDGTVPQEHKTLEELAANMKANVSLRPHPSLGELCRGFEEVRRVVRFEAQEIRELVERGESDSE